MEQCRGGCSHEMVNSPATAATMAYPTLEEERRWSGHEHGHDLGHDLAHDLGHRRRHRRHDVNHFRHETVEHSRNPESLRSVCATSVEQRAADRHVIGSCNGCCNRGPTATVLNRDFAHSYRTVPEASEGQSAREPSECPSPVDRQRKPNERRSRKQSQPRKVTWNQEFEEDDVVGSSGGKPDDRPEEATSRPRKETVRTTEPKKRCQRRSTWRKLLKCRLCPDDALARGSIRRPYHTKASLALHKLWRHGRRKRNSKNCASKERAQAQVSSITLKATVFTSPGYGYHR